MDFRASASLLIYFLLIAEEAVEESEAKFNPFMGTGRRLDGKQIKDQPPTIPSSTVATAVTAKDSTASTSTSTQQPGVKLVFGSRAAPTDKQKVNSFSPYVSGFGFCACVRCFVISGSGKREEGRAVQ